MTTTQAYAFLVTTLIRAVAWADWTGAHWLAGQLAEAMQTLEALRATDVSLPAVCEWPQAGEGGECET